MNPDRLQETFAAFKSDVIRAGKEAEDSLKRGVIDQFWARTFVRALFAFVEAYVYELKVIIRGAAANGELQLSEGEIAMLADITYELDDSGHVKEKPRFIPSERNLRFVHGLATRLFGLKVYPRASDARYQSFKTSVAVRNE
jgi:hypothetical protein